MNLATAPAVDALIATGAPVAIGVSGGKDSQAAALAVAEHLDRRRHDGPRLLVHADLGSVEWAESLPACRMLAQHLATELVVLHREQGGLMERWESRWQSSVTRYQNLSTVTLVPCWSTPKMRFCTSEMKTHPIMAMLKRRFPGRTVINVTGIRREESRSRARSTVTEQSSDGRIRTWRPILDWSEIDVFSAIARHGMNPHPAYRHFFMNRVSCRFCIMSSFSDLIAAARQPQTHDLYRRMVSLEIRSSFAFQGARWLGDVAPDLLSSGQRDQLALSKFTARRRMNAERRITPAMLYVKGWPTRMLTDAEADNLAGVRREVSALFGFTSRCLDRDGVHARYAELLVERARRTGKDVR